MNKGQKQITYVAVGAVLLYLVYRWYQGQSGGSTGATSGAVAPDTSASDYASLAGQEQGDVAGLQGQNSQLFSQEQSDVAGLTGQIAGLGSQEQSDVTGLTGQIAGFSDQFTQLTGGQNTLQAEIAAIATGVQKINRAQTATIQTHRGGAFYNYYVKITGHAPPATVSANSFLWQAYKSGVKASALQKQPTHPSSKNKQIAHPNGNHTQQPHTKPATHHAPAPKPRQQPKLTPKPRTPAPVKPRPKTKPKPSGVRR
jgi:hypothetical protein